MAETTFSKKEKFIRELCKSLEEERYIKDEDLSIPELEEADVVLRCEDAVFAFLIDLGARTVRLSHNVYFKATRLRRSTERELNERGYVAYLVLITEKEIPGFMTTDLADAGVITIRKVDISEIARILRSFQKELQQSIDNFVAAGIDLIQRLTYLQKLSQLANFLNNRQLDQIIKSVSPIQDDRILGELCYFLGRTSNVEFWTQLTGFLHRDSRYVRSQASMALLRIMNWATATDIELTKGKDVYKIKREIMSGLLKDRVLTKEDKERALGILGSIKDRNIPADASSRFRDYLYGGE